MNVPRQVAQTPARPVLLYDGACGFCVRRVERWRRTTGDAVEYLAFQDGRVTQRYPELSREELEQTVHFIDTSRAVYVGAEAVFRLLAVNPSRRWVLQAYLRFPLFARASESTYRFVARHRKHFSRFA